MIIQSRHMHASFEDALKKNLPLIKYLANHLKMKCKNNGYIISTDDSISHVQLAAWLAWKKQCEQSVEGISPHSFGAYLNTFVKYVFSNFLRKEIGFNTINVESMGWMGDTMSDINEFEEYEVQELLNKKLEELEEKERVVIRKRYFEGKTLHDVAVELGVSIQTVSNIQNTAESKLYSKLKHLYNE
jgi:RNA polymerase sigma factor (sigma-70 family)